MDKYIARFYKKNKLLIRIQNSTRIKTLFEFCGRTVLKAGRSWNLFQKLDSRERKKVWISSRYNRDKIYKLTETHLSRFILNSNSFYRMPK